MGIDTATKPSFAETEGSELHREIGIATGSADVAHKMLSEVSRARAKSNNSSISSDREPDKDLDKDIQDTLDQMHKNGATDRTAADAESLLKLMSTGDLKMRVMEAKDERGRETMPGEVDVSAYERMVMSLGYATDNGKPLSPSDKMSDEKYLIAQNDHLPPAKFDADGSVTFPPITSSDVLKELHLVGAPKFDGQNEPARLPASFLDAIGRIGDDVSPMSADDKKLETALKQRELDWNSILNKMPGDDASMKEYYALRGAELQLKARETGSNAKR